MGAFMRMGFIMALMASAVTIAAVVSQGERRVGAVVVYAVVVFVLVFVVATVVTKYQRR